MDGHRKNLLANYGLTPADKIGHGMEAEVYRFGDGTVLKLYPRSTSVANLRRLQAFYAGFHRDGIPYALPSIERIVEEEEYIVTVEARLPGAPLKTLIARTALDHLDALFPTYINAVLELSRIEMPPETEQYKLFDPDALSVRAGGDWHQFLRRWLGEKLQTLSPYFERDVEAFGEKRRCMEAVLSRPYNGLYRLIHGDICPENILVDECGKVQALLDFGLFTQYGDPLFDVATAWVFFDMYDGCRANVRARLLRACEGRLGVGARGLLYRYLLLYSMLSANTYSRDCSDGHYEWCVVNLNVVEYWEQML